MTKDLPVHTDEGTHTKFVYIIETGGRCVNTLFWNLDNTVQCTYQIPANKWHLLDVTVPHSVQGIEPGMRRISVTGRIF